jgi:hypothetical protein
MNITGPYPYGQGMNFASNPMQWPAYYGSMNSVPVSQEFVARSRSSSAMSANLSPDQLQLPRAESHDGLMRALDDLKREVAEKLQQQSLVMTQIQQHIDTHAKTLESLRATIADNRQSHRDLFAAVQGQTHSISALSTHIDRQIFDSAETIMAALGANSAHAATDAPRTTEEGAPSPTAMPQETSMATIWIGGFQRRGQDDDQVATFLERTLGQPIVSFRRCTTGSALLEISASAVPSLLQLDGHSSSRFPAGIKIARARTTNVRKPEAARSSSVRIIPFKVPCSNYFSPLRLVNCGKQQQRERPVPTKKQREPLASPDPDLRTRLTRQRAQGQPVRELDVGSAPMQGPTPAQRLSRWERVPSAGADLRNSLSRRLRAPREQHGPPAEVVDQHRERQNSSDASAPHQASTGTPPQQPEQGHPSPLSARQQRASTPPPYAALTADSLPDGCLAPQLAGQAPPATQSPSSASETEAAPQGSKPRRRRQAHIAKSGLEQPAEAQPASALPANTPPRRQSSRTRHPHQSNLKGRRLEGTVGATGKEPSQDTIPVQPTTQALHDDFDLDAEGHYTFGTKRWVRHHRQIALDAGLSASEEEHYAETVCGDGNCVHRACATVTSCSTYKEVKAKTLTYVNDTLPRKLQDVDFLTAYPSLAELVKPDALARVIKHLQTDGDHAHETILQLNALAHHIDISVESLTTPGLFLGQYNGGTVHGRDKQRSKLALLMREDRRHGVYNSKDRNKFLGFSSGHVWIHRTRTAHMPRGAGNGRGPVPDRP